MCELEQRRRSWRSRNKIIMSYIFIQKRYFFSHSYSRRSFFFTIVVASRDTAWNEMNVGLCIFYKVRRLQRNSDDETTWEKKIWRKSLSYLERRFFSNLFSISLLLMIIIRWWWWGQCIILLMNHFWAIRNFRSFIFHHRLGVENRPSWHNFYASFKRI